MHPYQTQASLRPAQAASDTALRSHSLVLSEYGSVHPDPEDPVTLSQEVVPPVPGSDQISQDPEEVPPEAAHPYRIHALLQSLH